MPKIVARYEYVPDVGEKNDGELLVETAGYIPADVKIESMIDAGRRLVDFRSGYEFQDGEDIPEEYLDNTRNANYDLVDAQNDLADAQARLAALQAKNATPQVVASSVVSTPDVASDLNPKA